MSATIPKKSPPPAIKAFKMVACPVSCKTVAPISFSIRFSSKLKVIGKPNSAPKY